MDLVRFSIIHSRDKSGVLISGTQFLLAFRYNERLKVRLSQTVSGLMQTLEKLTSIPVQRMRLFYICVNSGDPFPVHLRFPNQKLHSLHIEDGDRFCVQVGRIRSLLFLIV